MPTKQAIYSKRWREKFPERKREYHRRIRYSLSPEQYAALVTAQRGLCAICTRSPGKLGLCVDHCHATGVVRGLLCSECNSAIGKMKDSPAQLRAAALYLEQRVLGVLPTAGAS